MYIVMVLLVMASDVVSRSDLLNCNSDRRKRFVCVWSGIYMFLFAALHDSRVGIDMFTYYRLYKQDSIMSIGEILSANSHYFEQGRDKGFHVLMHILSYISDSPQMMVGFIGLVLAIGVCYLFYKYSADPGLSIILFICLREYAFTVTGLRQALAMGLTFYSIRYIKECQKYKFIITVIIAGLFHASAWLFIFGYPLAKWRKTRLLMLTSIVLSFVAIIIGKAFVSVFESIPILGTRFLGKISAAQSASSGETMLFIFTIVAVLGYFFFARSIEFNNGKDEKSTDICLELNFTLVTVPICAISFAFADAYRLASYFMVGVFMLLPRIMQKMFSGRSYRYARFILITLLLFQYVYFGTSSGVDKYYFAWEK